MGEYQSARAKLDGFRQCPSYAPSASVYPLQDGRAVDASFSTPFGNGHGSSIVREIGIPASVICLLVVVRPLAVFLGVITAVVNSVNGMLTAWALSHISKKTGESLPLCAVGYSAPAVVGPFMVLGVAASSLHIAPAVVGSCSVTAVGMTVTEASCNGSFFVEAATGNRVTEGKANGRNRISIAARADAVPMHSTASIFGFVNNSPAPKSLSRKIAESSHNILQKVMLDYSKPGFGTLGVFA